MKWWLCHATWLCAFCHVLTLLNHASALQTNFADSQALDKQDDSVLNNLLSSADSSTPDIGIDLDVPPVLNTTVSENATSVNRVPTPPQKTLLPDLTLPMAQPNHTHEAAVPKATAPTVSARSEAQKKADEFSTLGQRELFRKLRQLSNPSKVAEKVHDVPVFQRYQAKLQDLGAKASFARGSPTLGGDESGEMLKLAAEDLKEKAYDMHLSYELRAWTPSLATTATTTTTSTHRQGIYNAYRGMLDQKHVKLLERGPKDTLRVYKEKMSELFAASVAESPSPRRKPQSLLATQTKIESLFAVQQARVESLFTNHYQVAGSERAAEASARSQRIAAAVHRHDADIFNAYHQSLARAGQSRPRTGPHTSGPDLYDRYEDSLQRLQGWQVHSQQEFERKFAKISSSSQKISSISSTARKPRPVHSGSTLQAEFESTFTDIKRSSQWGDAFERRYAGIKNMQP